MIYDTFCMSCDMNIKITKDQYNDLPDRVKLNLKFKTHALIVDDVSNIDADFTKIYIAPDTILSTLSKFISFQEYFKKTYPAKQSWQYDIRSKYQ